MARAKKTAQAVDYELIVVGGFLGYVKGQVITEADKVQALLESEWQHHFVKKPKQAPAEAGPSAD